MKENVKKLFNFVKERKVIFIGIFAMLCITSILLFLVSKGTFATTGETDTITITCPETAGGGDEVECSIIFNSVTISTQGVNTGYNVTEGMEFVSFTVADGWTPYANDSDGFLLVNFNGVTGSNLLGTVKYTIPTDAVSNSLYKVELVNPTIGDGEDVSITLENVYDEIRILSNINTLESVTLSSGSLNETFNKDINEHNAIVDSDKVTINAVKTDDNSTVSGDIGEVTLHYGTNTFNITVTSETGIENTYTLNIYRPYNFSSDNYIYSKEDNYIYTGTNTDSNSILSNIVLPTELTANIQNNKLIISYSNESLLEINIFNIISNIYIISEEIMYIESNLSYENLLNTITLNGVTAKIYDGNNNEVTSGTIYEGYKLKIYYNNTLLEEYTINEEYLNINNLDIDETNMIIKRLSVNTTYETVLSNITTTGNITIKDKDGNLLDNTNKVKTGDTIEIKFNSGTYKYTISVLGDINGDGIINLNDIIKISKHVLNVNTLTSNEYIYAADINNNNNVDLNDVVKLAKHIVNKIELQ